MGDITDSITFQIVSLALDTAAMRHQVLASNIANANTPKFAPSAVAFEDQLAVARSQLADGSSVTREALADVTPRVVAADRMAGGGVAGLDLQVAQMAKNTVQYQALVKALNRHVAILNVAINEGRR